MGKFWTGILRSGLLCLTLGISIQTILWGVGTIDAFRESTAPASAASTSAIKAPGILVTCPHHEHGCPKDCMCPKTFKASTGNTEVGNAIGAIREPALTTCTEHGSQSPSPQTEVFIAAGHLPFSFPASESLVVPEQAAQLRDRLNDPPQKIPIA